MNLRSRHRFLAGLATLGLAAGSIPRARSADSGWVSARDARIAYDGRIDFRDPLAPVLIWEGTRVALDFSGDRIEVRFGASAGQNFFNAVVDGRATLLDVPEGPGSSFAVRASGAAGRRHHLVLYKRTEAVAGTVHFSGFGLRPDSGAWRPAAPAPRLRIEFLGDSITAGACNEDGPEDQWTDRKTHDFAFSYAQLAADALGADLHCLAVSGMGIAAGWVKPKAGQIWDKLYPEPTSPQADLKRWRPDVVCVNFGENDASFPAAHGQPFPSDAYTRGYVALVRALRTAYPQAEVVLLRGGMGNGAHNLALRAAWRQASRELEAGDRRISHYVFVHWSKTHPRVADDRIIANELVGWLRRQPFWDRSKNDIRR